MATFVPLEWHEGGLKYEISKLQLKSMIGGDSYVFNAEKSIAKCFRTFLCCQVSFLATFVAVAWHAVQGRILKCFKFQSISMLGVDSHIFFAEKSITSDFKYLKSMVEPLCDIQVAPIL